MFSDLDDYNVWELLRKIDMLEDDLSEVTKERDHLKLLLSSRDTSTNASFNDARAQSYSMQFGTKVDIKRQLGIK